MFPLRRVITTAKRMQHLHGWNRRRAIRFALEQVRRNPSQPAPAKAPKALSARSEAALEYLTHNHRATAAHWRPR